MQIDWITVAAQIVNFLILAWLLQRFLYGPVTRAMDRRENRIAQRLRDADGKREEAENEARTYREMQAELERCRESLLAEARDKAEQERQALQQTARTEVEQRKQAWLKQVEAQRAEFLRDIRERSTEHFYELARRALGDLADTRLEEQIAAVFVDKLAALDKETKKKIARECSRFENRATVHSRFDLSTSEKSHITKAIHEQIFEHAQVTYEERAGIACGLELKAGGQTVSWSLESYLDELERRIEADIGGSPSAAA
jgi:F-type H+-transporting ATPase subunit b